MQGNSRDVDPVRPPPSTFIDIGEASPNDFDLDPFCPDGTSPEIRKAWAAKKELIEHEIEQGPTPWAGRYFYGDGLGFNFALILAPNSGFVCYWRGCKGVYDRDYGEVEVAEDGYIRIGFQHTDGIPFTGAEFMLVQRGSRTSLVSTDGTGFELH